MEASPLVRSLKGRLIVSVQAYPGEPLRHPETMAQMAAACEQGGAAAIRCQGLADIAAIKGRVEVPVIGLWKEGHEGVYITPTLRHAVACVNAGADVVALDATSRPRPDGRSFAQTVSELKAAFPQVLVMADCGSVDDAKASQDGGADLVGTTLAGYTGERPKTEGPDWEVIEQVLNIAQVPVIAEGRIHTPAHAAQAIQMGVHAVVVGTAITHPTSITSWFVGAVKNVQ